MADVLYIRACEIRRLIPRGNPANLADMTGNHTYAREARAHADSRQTCKAICPGPLSGSPPERYAFGMIYLIFTLQQKPIWSHAREGVSTSGICWDEGDAFLQPMRTRKTVLSRRELRTTPLRSMAPCAKVFTSYAGEFDNNVSYMPGQIEQCIIV